MTPGQLRTPANPPHPNQQSVSHLQGVGHRASQLARACKWSKRPFRRPPKTERRQKIISTFPRRSRPRDAKGQTTAHYCLPSLSAQVPSVYSGATLSQRKRRSQRQSGRLHNPPSRSGPSVHPAEVLHETRVARCARIGCVHCIATNHRRPSQQVHKTRW
jgi:hypothetical protein